MNIFSFLQFGNGTIRKALRQGGVVIDVRTANEFDQGKVPGSINIPVDRVALNTERIIQMQKPVIFCCASGQRSAAAKKIMDQKGLKEVFNGGSWENVLKIVKTL